MVLTSYWIIWRCPQDLAFSIPYFFDSELFMSVLQHYKYTFQGHTNKILYHLKKVTPGPYFQLKMYIVYIPVDGKPGKS